MISRKVLVCTLVLILLVGSIPNIRVKAQNKHFFEKKGVYEAEVDKTQGELILSAWKGEVEMRFKLPGLPSDSNLVGKTIEFDYPGFKVRIYEIPENEVFRNGGIEYEVVLPVKPPSNQWSFQIQTKGLEFYYQPPLYEEYIPGAITVNATHAYDKDGRLIVHRPIEIVGSYAVYHKTKRDNEYRTGKVYHIPRIHLLDSKGEEDYARMNITKDVFTIKLPQDFLDTASYPIIVDPGFGYDTKGGTEQHIENKMGGSLFTMPEDGTGTSITVYLRCTSQAKNSKCAIYKHSDLSLEEGTEELSVPISDAWKTFNFGTGPTLTQSTDYILIGWGPSGPGSIYMYYDTGEANQGHDKTIVYGAWPDPLVGPSHNTHKWSIYCNYTTDGGEEYKRDLTQAFAVASNVYGYWGATRALTQALSVAGSVYRTWDATRALTQALSVAGSVYRTWDAKRVLTQAINLASAVEGILSEAATFIRDLTQAITVGSSVDAYKGIRYIRDLSQAISYTINVDVSHILGTGWSLLTVFVKSLDDLGIPSASVSVFVVGGSNVFSEATNSSGYTSTYNISNANYTAMITKENYISTDTFLNLAHNTIIEVTLTHAEEAIVLSFNIELLVLAAVSMIFTLMMLYTRQPGMGVIAGTLAFVFWEATGLYYMYTNIADQWAIGYLFIGLGLICVIMTVYCGLRTLDPKAASKDSDFL